MSNNLYVLRARKGVPGVGRKLSKFFDAYEVTANSRPAKRIEDNAIILNYGRSVWPVWADDMIERGGVFLNKPKAVALAVDKRLTLNTLFGCNAGHISFFTDKEQALHYYEVTKRPLIVRLTATGKKGNGILYWDGEGELPDAPLYTVFFDKTHEFRVHVFRGKVIDFVQKKRMGKEKRAKLGIEESDGLIRNHKRGWVFARKNLVCDDKDPWTREHLGMMGIEATKALGLDFAAVDILAQYSEHGVFRDARVCEVNSAPGMSDKNTFNAYTNAIQEYIDHRASLVGNVYAQALEHISE